MPARSCSPWSPRSLALLAAALAGCTAERGLRISEVGVNAVELYLDEPSTNTLSLADHMLHVASTDAAGAREDHLIHLIGSLDGGQYLVVWEQSGHVGPPTRDNYQNFFGQSVLGIALEPGTLGTFDNSRPYALRVSAHRTRYVFPFFYAIDVSDDEVRFGPGTRPDLGGAFTEDHTLDQVMRSLAQSFLRGRTVRRKTDTVGAVKVPRDRDLERDWTEANESFGTAD